MPLQVQSLRPDGLLLVSTLDGSLHALSKQTGDLKWTLKDDPIIQGPKYVTETAFLSDPADGSLYLLGAQKQQGLMKLPFTIPELVHASPCRSSDGVFYTGRKQDVWFVVDPESGETQMTLTTDSPSTPRLYIGRTRESGPGCSPRSGQPPRFALPGLVIAIQVESGQSVSQSTFHLALNKELGTEHNQDRPRSALVRLTDATPRLGAREAPTRTR